MFEKVLVVSKFTEDVSWTKNVKCPVIIYDKSNNPIEGSISLPNVEREAHTLLYHIIENYNNLPDCTIFCQGDPRGNPVQYTYDEVVEIINNCENVYKSLMDSNGNTDLDTYFIEESKALYNALFGPKEGLTWYSMGCEYILPKQNITCRPLDFYELLFERLCNNYDFEVTAYSLEPLLGTIFNPEVILLKMY